MAGNAEFDTASWVIRHVHQTDVPDHVMVLDSTATDPLTRAYLSGPAIAVNFPLINVMTAIAGVGDRVLDVGAFAGEFALAAAARGSDVVAIEADPKMAASVALSAEANGFDNLRLVNAAAGDRPGVVRFASAGPWGQVVQSADPIGESAVQVTLDDVLAAVGWDRVRFVKIDIEGSEARALAGAPRLLGAEDAPALLLESNLAPFQPNNTDPAALLQTLEGYGYSLFLVTPEQDIIEWDSTQFQPVVVADFLALKGALPSDFGLVSRPRLTLKETAARVKAECAEYPEHRVWIAWGLRFASPDLLAMPAVRATIRTLTADANEAVREAIAWFDPAAPAPVRPADAAVPTVMADADVLDGAAAAADGIERGAALRAWAAEQELAAPATLPAPAAPTLRSRAIAEIRKRSWLLRPARRLRRLARRLRRVAR